MKRDVKQLLKDVGKGELFTDDRYKIVHEVMKYGQAKDLQLKRYLSIDPMNKAQFIADHIIILSDLGKI